LVDYVKEQGEHLPLDNICLFARQIFAAVAFVHGLSMMHRDIKPENFRFKDAATDQLQLLDFGFAKPCSGFPAAHSITGTLLYAAPEVFDGFYWRECDVWSCGVVFFQLFTGYPPFQTADVQILRSLHRDPVLTGDGLFRGAAQRQVPRGARNFLLGLLAVDPSTRISAQAAFDHEWFQSDLWTIDPDEDAPARKSTLRRDNSQIMEQGEDVGGIKRSYFVWDLAAASATSAGEDDSTDTGP
jgi:calcium-dependent protein kinase